MTCRVLRASYGWAHHRHHPISSPLPRTLDINCAHASDVLRMQHSMPFRCVIAMLDFMFVYCHRALVLAVPVSLLPAVDVAAVVVAAVNSCCNVAICCFNALISSLAALSFSSTARTGGTCHTHRRADAHPSSIHAEIP